MTVVLALRCRDGVVLAADSQRTEPGFRQEIPKLFASPSGIVWGVAGVIAIQQELYAAMDVLQIDQQPSRVQARAAIVRAMKAATEEVGVGSIAPRLASQGIFAWYDAAEKRTFLLKAYGDGFAEFARKYTAVGAPTQLAQFAFSSSEHLGYENLPLEAAKMIAFNAADDVIRATPSGVSHPIQMGVATATESSLLTPVDVRAIEDTVAAFREHQHNFLVRDDRPDAQADTGIRP